MRSVKILTVFIMGLFLAVTTMAQERTVSLNINYAVGIPTGSFSKVVPGTSFSGWNANILYGINNKISVGLGTGFQDFYHKNPRDVYKTGDGDVSAVLTNSIQTIPVLAEGKYNFSPSAVIQPYVALGVGGNVVLYRQFLGEFGSSYNKFKFAARPEAGINIPFGRTREKGFNVSAAYNYMPYNENGIDAFNNIAVSAGVKFPLHGR